MSAERFALELTLQDDYRFAVNFGPELPALTVDEPPPLGGGQGPNPARLLATAVGHCLGASLLFCLRRYRIPVQELRTTVEGTLVRNERKRLRIGELHVRLAPSIAPADRERLGRCLEQFEDFCIVTESVRQGIPVTVQVAADAAPATPVTPAPAAA